MGFPGGSVIKNPPAYAGDTGDLGSVPGGRSPRGGNGNVLQYILQPGESHGLYNPRGHKKSDRTE